MTTETDAVDVWEDWLTLYANRDDVAVEYASLMKTNGADWSGYATLNAAILRRWSPAGLRYIKERAWRELEKGDGEE